MLNRIERDVQSNKLCYAVHAAKLRRERREQWQCDIVGLCAAVALYGLYKLIMG